MLTLIAFVGQLRCTHQTQRAGLYTADLTDYFQAEWLVVAN
jgi:hypothetical protein